MKEGVLYKKLSKNIVQCVACNWHCKIAENKTGICGVRKNIDGKLYLLVDSRPISVHTDPIEKKPLYHFRPGSKIFSIGTLGCNFGCIFCQNYTISQASKDDKTNPENSGFPLSPEEIVAYCIKNKISSIAFTYNEPTIFSEFAVDIMKLAKKHKIKGVYVSNGYESMETLKFLDPYIDAYNIDLKSFSESFYRNICKAKLTPVLETIKEIYRRKKWLELTTLLIPGKNDSKKEMKKAAEFIKNISTEIPWHFSAYYPEYKMFDAPPTPPETLFMAHKIAKEAGIKYVYTGNVRDDKFSHTLCPKCDTLLIERHYFYETVVHFKNGVCPKCKTKIVGIWK